MIANPLLLSASKSWCDNQPLEAGRLLFQNLPANDRPYWAARILQFTIRITGVKSQLIDDVIQVAIDPQQWPRAHAAFSATRKLVLHLDRRPSMALGEEILRKVALLAETVAKVTYNATNPDDEFDEDSGWWVVANLYSICKALDKDFLNQAWTLLSSEDPTLPPHKV